MERKKRVYLMRDTHEECELKDVFNSCRVVHEQCTRVNRRICTKLREAYYLAKEDTKNTCKMANRSKPCRVCERIEDANKDIFWTFARTHQPEDKEEFVRVPARFCPACGREINKEET